jgi:small subunit ribosomal protein S6
MSDRRYELVYILVPDAAEQEIADLQAQVEGIVARFEGAILKTEPWGRRKLAYEIGPNKEGVYVLHVFTGISGVVKELDRRLKVNDRIIRHLVVRVDEEEAVADRRKAARQEESARRRAARGLPPLPEGAPEEAAVVTSTNDVEAPQAPAEA